MFAVFVIDFVDVVVDFVVVTIKNNEDSFNRLKKTSQVVVVVNDVCVFIFVDVNVDNVDIDFVVVTIKKL